MWASFQVPKVRCHTSKVDYDYSGPPAPHSLDRDGSIPVPLGYAIQQPGLPADTASEDPGLCKGPTTLGRKSAATNPK